MRTIAFAAAVVLLSSMAQADIIEWHDASGVRHFTNLIEEVPKENRDAMQVVVDEAVRRPPAEAPAAVSPPASVEPRREAEVIYDRSRAAAYMDGWRAGLAASMPTESGGSSVQINGPLVTNAIAPAPYVPYLPPYYSPLVTTSFDRGRSRHLTLRMLLQDQFALDREGPFGFVERWPPASVALAPFLPRGLPHHHAPALTRVITR